MASQAPLSMGFPRQEYWSVLPFPSPGDIHDPGIKPVSPALAGGFFITEPLGKSPIIYYIWLCNISSEKAMAPHSSTLAWKIPWTEELVGCSPWGRYESDTTEWLHFHFSLSRIGEGNGNLLQCSCLEISRNRGAWWTAVYGDRTVGHDWSDLAAAACHIS